MQRSRAIASRTIEKLGSELETEYRAERASASENLYNDFAEAIDRHKPSVETLLYVLEMIRFDLLANKHSELFGPGAQVEIVHLEAQKTAALAIG